MKDLLEFFKKMALLIRFGVTVCEILAVEISKELLSQQKHIKILYF